MIITIKCKRHPDEQLSDKPFLDSYNVRTNEFQVDTSDMYCEACAEVEMDQALEVTIEVVTEP